MAAEQHSTHADDEVVPGTVGEHVRIPPELIVASGVGRKVTNWHRDLLQDRHDDTGQDHDGAGRVGE